MELKKPSTSIEKLSWYNRGFYKDNNRISLAIIAVVVLITRLPLLTRKYPLSFDDGVYLMSTKHVANGSTPYKDVFSSQGPYFLEILSLPSRFLKNIYWAPRISTLLCALAISIVIFYISKRFMSDGIALLCSLSVALSGSLLRTSMAITADIMVVTFSLICILATIRLCEKNTLSRRIVLGIAIGVGVGIKSIFMIPTLIYIVVSTRKLDFSNRVFFVTISLLTFALPFFLFGITRVTDQSIFYHLGKNETLDLNNNLSKIFTTLTSFDLFISLGFVVAGVALLFKFAKNYQILKVSKTSKDIKQKFLRTFNYYNSSSISILVLLPTAILLMIQNPLFRNHLVCLVPLLSFFIFSSYTHVYPRINSSLQRYANIFIIVLMFVISIISINNMFNDSFIKGDSDRNMAIKSLEGLPKNSLVLTEEPGIPYFAKQDVPKFLEDTSQYRFESKDKNLSISESTFSKYIKGNKVCAIVDSPIHNSKVISFEEIAPSSWKYMSYGKYKIWINRAKSCN